MSEQGNSLAWSSSTGTENGLGMREREALNLIMLRGQPNAGWAQHVQQILGTKLPVAPNTAVQTRVASLLWLGPDAFLAVLETRAIADELCTSVHTTNGYALDISHSRCVLRLRGSCARTVLDQGCLVDLHPRIFRAGHCAHTLLGRMPVLIHCLAADRFDLYVLRSYASSMRLWLQSAWIGAGN